MKQLKKISVFLLCISFVSLGLYSQTNATLPKHREVVKVETPSENFHLYLLIGQSNMAGRGIVEPQDTVGNKRILRLNKAGDWEIAKEPVHFDKSSAGVGPGLTFAREMIKENDSIVIGLIPCSAGGSGIDIWLNDLFWEQTLSYPYNNALLRTKLAMKDGTLKGVLWHQGEGDCAPEKLNLYQEKLISLIYKIRQAFAVSDLPFIAGELPEFNTCSKRFNPILYEVQKTTENVGVVSGAGLLPMPDGVHIDASSEREFGKRYAEKMKEIEIIDK